VGERDLTTHRGGDHATCGTVADQGRLTSAMGTCQTVQVNTAHIPTVTVAEVPSGAYLLDVREDDEWAAGHAPDAVHLPMMEVPVRFGEIPQDQDVIVVCRMGGRSAQVVGYLRQQGWDNVINLDGGMASWAAAGRPVVTDDGRAPQIA
jgi:rhodanese-related sulfurtransferase